MRWYDKVKQADPATVKIVVAGTHAAVYIAGKLTYSGDKVGVMEKFLWAQGTLAYAPTLTPVSEGTVAKQIESLNL